MAIQDRSPTGNGTTSLWDTATGAPTKWQACDDRGDGDPGTGSPDDATTYMQDNDANEIQHFTFSAFAITSSTITSVINTVRGARDAASTGACSTDHIIRVNGTNYTAGGVSHTVADVWAQDDNVWLTNPNTGSAWTEADVEGTGANPLQQCGVQAGAMNVGDVVNCTMVYISVDYTAAGAVSARASHALVGSAAGWW